MFKEFCDGCEEEDGTDYRDSDEGVLCTECYNSLSSEEKEEYHKA